VRLLFGLVVVVLVLGAAEIAGRAAYGFLDRAREGQLRAKPFLKPYEMPDPERPDLWRPRPGVTLTLAETRAMVEQEGLVLSQEILERGAETLGVRDDDVIFTIGPEGYKGPPLDRDGTRPRVLSIGDSCTFGSLIDHYSWPRSAERALASTGTRVEVVNAGVNGYSPAHALARIDEFRALDPAVAVLYIGWNALYGDSRAVRDERPALVRFAATLATRLRNRSRSAQEIALEAYRQPKRPDPDAPELERLAGYRPRFLADVAALVRELSAAGVRVYVATLPGLYLRDAAPSARALEIGHLPQFTDNPYVVAAMADGYNEALRALAGETGAGLIDLDAWSRTAFEPRDAYFTDTVHLTEIGQERIGAEIARAIASDLATR
jgi:lysophospholipase L1-like esterase